MKTYIYTLEMHYQTCVTCICGNVFEKIYIFASLFFYTLRKAVGCMFPISLTNLPKRNVLQSIPYFGKIFWECQQMHRSTHAGRLNGFYKIYSNMCSINDHRQVCEIMGKASNNNIYKCNLYKYF